MSQTAKPRSKKSTIVRVIHQWSFALIRRSFACLERISPSLGARWAERLWFTAPKPPALQRLPKGLDPGIPFEVAAEGFLLRGQSWGAGPNAYLVHGWGGWGTQLAGFVAPLVKAGYRVVTFDMPSHGDSAPGALGPQRGTILEFAAALKAVVAAQGPAEVLIAHSLGSTATALAMREGLKTVRAVFLAPMADPVYYTHTFARVLGFGQRIRVRLHRRIEKRVGLPMAFFSVPRMARDMAVPPLLVVHDQDDHETHWTDGAEIARAWRGAKLVTTHGLGHRRVLFDRDVISQVVSFAAASADSQGARRPALAVPARVPVHPGALAASA